MNHHMKSAFTQNMQRMMEEMGLLDEDDRDETDDALKKLLDKNRYEQQYRYPIWEAMCSQSENTMSTMVSIRNSPFRTIFRILQLRNKSFRDMFCMVSLAGTISM